MKWGILLSVVSICVTASALGTPPTGSYKKIVDEMMRLESAHPDFAKVFSIGTNDEGTELLAMRVSVTPTQIVPEKIGHLMVGTHHGNETKAPVLVMSFMTDLLARYENGEFLRGQLADIEWTLIPVLNVSGYNVARREERGIDPNRDYPGPCLQGEGGELKSIRTIMDFMKIRTFSGAITVHGYIGTMTYPWGVNTDKVETHDHNQFAQVTAKAAQENGYRHGTSTDLIYPAEGTFEDYVYWKHGMWSLLIELESGSKQDIENTTRAAKVYFDALEASPSMNYAFEGQCLASRGLDLRNE